MSSSARCRSQRVWQRVRDTDGRNSIALKTARNITSPPRSPRLRKADRAFVNLGKEPTRTRAVITEPSRPRSESPLCLESLLRVTTDPVFLATREGVILESHVPPDNDLLLPADSLAGKPVADLFSSSMAGLALDTIAKALDSGETQIFCTPHLLPGRVRQLEVRITRNGPNEVLVLVRDVTDRQLLEKEILEIANQEQIRIGQDLHDGLGQHLTGITFLTRALERKLSAREIPEAAEAAEIGRLVIQALSQTRNLARGIFPVELESSGLVAAFHELAGTVEELFQISCVVECPNDAPLADQSVANHLFRFAQEAVNNSVKHGKASCVAIRLRRAEQQLILSISDNGVGLPKQGIKLKGLGLRIMGYRAQKLGGTLDLESPATGGTSVTCTIPDPAPNPRSA